MKGGGWTEAESYRDLIKDKEVAVSLEQQSRIAADRRISRAANQRDFARHEAEPQNVDSRETAWSAPRSKG